MREDSNMRRGLLLWMTMAAAAATPAFGHSVASAGASSKERAASIPDFSGMWGRNAFGLEPLASGPSPVMNLNRLANGASDRSALVGDYNNPILKPQAAEVLRQKGQISLSGHAFPDPSNQCASYSPPYIFSHEEGMQFLQGKHEVTILYNQDDQVRHVRLNAAHPLKVIPSAMGDSVGHYEGDTLVVDTIGVKVGPLTMVDDFGTPQSAALHLVERYRLIDGAQAKEAQERYEKTEGRIGGPAGAMLLDPDTTLKGLQLRLTVDDPKVFTTSWSAQVTYRRSTIPWLEQVCAEDRYDYYSNRADDIPQAKKPDF
jgi:hypothetical protein